MNVFAQQEVNRRSTTTSSSEGGVAGSSCRGPGLPGDMEGNNDSNEVPDVVTVRGSGRSWGARVRSAAGSEANYSDFKDRVAFNRLRFSWKGTDGQGTGVI